MRMLSSIKEFYLDGGLSAVMKEISKYILVDSQISPILKSLLGDRLHQKIYMRVRLGYWPQIKEPRTFNEKILHRKIYTNNELFPIIEDKWKVRDYVIDKIGEDILPEVYHVTENPETIPFNELPNKYIVKPTHLSGGANIIVEDSMTIDEEYIKDRCFEWLKQTHGEIKGEYWYSDIKPRILIEEYIQSENHRTPIDYKFLVFHGEVKAVHVTLDRFDNQKTTRNFYTPDWEPIDVELHFPQGEPISKPKNLDSMLRVAETLGEDFEHIRVDLYSPNENEIVFGEMTVAESSGGNPFIPIKYDYEFGSYW